MSETTKHTSAAEAMADLTGDPGLRREVEECLAKCKRINELASKRAKANITAAEMAEEMNVTEDFVYRFEDSTTDEEAGPLAMGLYERALETLTRDKEGRQ